MYDRATYDCTTYVQRNGSKYCKAPTQVSCTSNGRWYNIDSTWQSVISSNPLDAALLNEEYCATRRLAYAWNARSNNVGAAVTASVTQPAITLWGAVVNQASDFLKAVASGGDAQSAATTLKTSLSNAL